MRKLICAVVAALAFGSVAVSPVNAAPEPAPKAYNSAPASSICHFWGASEIFGYGDTAWTISATNQVLWGQNHVVCHWHWQPTSTCYHIDGIYNRHTGAHAFVGSWLVC